MYRRRFFAFFSATFPWVWCCCLGWWVDRFLVEMGHRSSSSEICSHNDLQYVRQHQAVTGVAVLVQIIWVCLERRKQFQRESELILGYDSKSDAPIPRLGGLYLLQAGICLSWAGVLACIFDVSPWLCLSHLLKWRASLIAVFAGTAILLVRVERRLYTWLQTHQLPVLPGL